MTGNPFDALLATIQTVAIHAKLARNVLFNHLVPNVATKSKKGPQWLFTSGKPNRFNPAGVNCLYMAGDHHVAGYECTIGLPGEPFAHAPMVTYWADVKLSHVLDLTDAASLKALRLNDTDLYGPWPTKGKPSPSQLLGDAVARSTAIVAIRYPSVAARALGHSGVNVVIFQDRVVAPDSVQIIGHDSKPLAKWP
jgi:RES domain-containing protein